MSAPSGMLASNIRSAAIVNLADSVRPTAASEATGQPVF